MEYLENLLGGLNAVLYFLFYMYDVNDEESYKNIETHIRNTYKSKCKLKYVLDLINFQYLKLNICR